MDTNSSDTTCSHSHKVTLDARVGYGEVTVTVDDEPILDIGQDDPEEVEFPTEVTDLGIENDSGGSTVNVTLTVCLTCHKVV